MYVPAGIVQQQRRHGGGGGGSSVHDLAMASNPYAYYDFQDADYSMGLQDVSGNGRHLSALNAGPHIHPAVRSTTTKAAWWSVWVEPGAEATNKAGSAYFFYDPSGVNLDGAFFYPGNTNQTRMTLTFSWSENTTNSGNFCKIIGWRDANSSERFVCHTEFPSGTGHTMSYRMAENHTTNVVYKYAGGWTRTEAWSIITMRFDGSTGTAQSFRDGVGIGSVVDGTKNSLYAPAATTSPFEFPGNFSSGGSIYGRSDFLLINNDALPDADIIALHDAYLSELL